MSALSSRNNGDQQMNTSSKWLLTFVLLAAPVAAIATIATPEIDPASTMSGLTLLAGCLLVLRGRKSRK
jgi:hypothetical protein